MIGQYKYSMYHHVYIKDGEIHTIRYKRMVDDMYDEYPQDYYLDDANKDSLSAHHIYMQGNHTFVDYIKLHVQYCDYEFMRLIFKRVDEYYIDGSFTDYEFVDGLYHGVTL